MLRPHAPFLSPPPRNERTVTVTLGGDTYSGWASAAGRTCEAGSSPACALDCLINEVQNITKSSERLTGHASMALAAGGKLPWVDGRAGCEGDAEIRRGEGDPPLGEAQGSG